jgi:hypothetical protein
VARGEHRRGRPQHLDRLGELAVAAGVLTMGHQCDAELQQVASPLDLVLRTARDSRAGHSDRQIQQGYLAGVQCVEEDHRPVDTFDGHRSRSPVRVLVEPGAHLLREQVRRDRAEQTE